MPPLDTQTDAPKALITEKATGLRMDPRIARRWVEVRRAQGRRRLRVLAAIGSAFLVVALFFGSLYTPLFKVRHVRVSVQGSIPTSEVARLSRITGHTLMIRVNDSTVERRLDAVARLGDARVSTHWPGTVSIRVAVRHAVAVIAESAPSQWAEVDATGRVIATVSVRPAGLPQLLGVGTAPAVGQWLAGSVGSSAAIPPSGQAPLADMNATSDSQSVPAGAAALLAIAAAVPLQVGESIGSMTTSNPGALTLTVAATRGSAGPITVMLGDGSQLAKKLTALTTLLTQADLSGVNAVDLTVPDRPAALTVQKTPYSLSTHAGGSH